MGLLVVGEPLNWEDTKKHAEYVRNAIKFDQTLTHISTSFIRKQRARTYTINSYLQPVQRSLLWHAQMGRWSGVHDLP